MFTCVLFSVCQPNCVSRGYVKSTHWWAIDLIFTRRWRTPITKKISKQNHPQDENWNPPNGKLVLKKIASIKTRVNRKTCQKPVNILIRYRIVCQGFFEIITIPSIPNRRLTIMPKRKTVVKLLNEFTIKHFFFFDVSFSSIMVQRHQRRTEVRLYSHCLPARTYSSFHIRAYLYLI